MHLKRQHFVSSRFADGQDFCGAENLQSTINFGRIAWFSVKIVALPIKRNRHLPAIICGLNQSALCGDSFARYRGCNVRHN
jgi:hypothetical protein